MTSETIFPSLADCELLARFVMLREWIRSDGTVKQEAFIPPRDLNLSVTRHSGLSDEDLWRRGRAVASQRGKPILGRADISVRNVRGMESGAMNVESAPLPENPEHAHIVGWPIEKPAQKNIAQRLAAAATLVRIPEQNSTR